MASTNFPRCFSATLVHEGGYVHHAKDPGGATNKGIIQRTYDSFRRAKGLPKRSVRLITDDEVADIYRSRYWNAVNGDNLPDGLDYVAYDGGVNSGPKNGAKWLQRALGVVSDGFVGGDTIKAAKNAKDKPAVIRKACSIRMGFLKSLKHWGTFGKGWTRRVIGVEALAVKMAIMAAGAVTPAAVDTAIKDDAKVEAKSAGKAATKNTTTAGAGGVATGGSAVQADPSQGFDLSNGLVIAFVLVAVIATAVFIWRAYVQRTRAKVYSDIAKS
jgi:lysozyme family protein